MKRKHFIKEMKWREIKFNILVDVDIFRSQSFPYFALNYRGVTFLNEVVNQNLCLIVALHQHLTVILTRESSQASSLNFTDAGGGGGRDMESFIQKVISILGLTSWRCWSVKFPSFITEYRDRLWCTALTSYDSLNIRIFRSNSWMVLSLLLSIISLWCFTFTVLILVFNIYTLLEPFWLVLCNNNHIEQRSKNQSLLPKWKNGPFHGLRICLSIMLKSLKSWAPLWLQTFYFQVDPLIWMEYLGCKFDLQHY